MKLSPCCSKRCLRQASRTVQVCLFFTGCSLVLLTLPAFSPVQQSVEVETPLNSQEPSLSSPQQGRPSGRPAQEPSPSIKSADDGQASQRRVDRNISTSQTTTTTIKSITIRQNNKVYNTNIKYEKYTYPRTASQEFGSWSKWKNSVCDKKIDLYAWSFAHLRDLSIDPTFCTSRARAGAEIQHVFSQDELAEYYTIGPGCFQVSCPDEFSQYNFISGRDYLNAWLKNLTNTNGYADNSSVNFAFTIALTRFDYANLYWTMNDWYTTFLTMAFLNQTADTTEILLIDTHPKGNLDPVWSVLFENSTRLSQHTEKVLYKNIVWGLPGSSSFLVGGIRAVAQPPLLNEFREFFLSRYRMNTSRSLDCRRVSVLFVWRKDYVAHPRNPSGTIQRKIANEQELLDGIRKLHPTFDVRGVQLDQLDMRDQLAMISQTDIYIGMHGAGLALTLLLQRHATLIELFPSYSSNGNDHFADLARWRNLSYIKWVNFEPSNERSNYETYLPLSVIDSLVTMAANNVCVGNETRTVTKPLFVRLPSGQVVQSYLRNRPLRNNRPRGPFL